MLTVVKDRYVMNEDVKRLLVNIIIGGGKKAYATVSFFVVSQGKRK